MIIAFIYLAFITLAIHIYIHNPKKKMKFWVYCALIVENITEFTLINKRLLFNEKIINTNLHLIKVEI